MNVNEMKEPNEEKTQRSTEQTMSLAKCIGIAAVSSGIKELIKNDGSRKVVQETTDMCGSVCYSRANELLEKYKVSCEDKESIEHLISSYAIASLVYTVADYS